MSEIGAGLAVVVGIDYTGAAKLKNARRDACKVGELLHRVHGFDLLKVCDEAATRPRLEALLRGLPALARSYQQVVLYFAGHGRRDAHAPGGQDGELLPYGFKEDGDRGLSMAEVRRVFEELEGTQQILLILDCCAAGAMGGRRDAEPVVRPLFEEQLRRMRSLRAVQLLASATHDQQALDSGDPIAWRQAYDNRAGDHSPFARAVIDALTRSDDRHEVDRNRDGIFLASELYHFASGRLGAWNANVFQAHEQQPVLHLLRGHEGGEFLFFARDELPARRFAVDAIGYLNPFRDGVYREADRLLFFGRERAVDELVAGVEAHRVTVVAGPSGCGKSSLVRAGVLPKLRDRGWQIYETGAGGPLPAEGKYVYVIDEIGRSSDPAIRAAVAAAGAVIKTGRDCRVLATLRTGDDEDLLALLPEAWRPAFEPTMDREELRRTIESPAREAVLFFTHKPRKGRTLPDTLLDEVKGSPGALALLSGTLHGMYEGQLSRVDRRLTWEDYDRTGGVRARLLRAADRVADAHAGSEDTLRRILLRLVEPRGTPRRRAAPRHEFQGFGHEAEDGRVARILDDLEAARLIVRGATIELAHDALVLDWPKMQDLRREAGDRFAHIHELWTRAATPGARPLEREALRALVRFLRADQTRPSWWVRLRDFIAPRALVDRAPMFELNARERALALRSLAARRNRRLGWLAAAALAVTVVIVTERAAARASAERAERRAVESLQQLRERARLAGGGAGALERGLEAYRDTRDHLGRHAPEAIGPLSEIARAAQARPRASLQLGGQTYDLRTAGGEVVAVVGEGDERVVVRWRPGHLPVRARLGAEARGATLAAISPDARRVVTAVSGCVVSWDARTGAPETPTALCPSGGTQGCSELAVLAFSGDGSRLAAGSVDGTVSWWDLASRTRLGGSRFFEAKTVRLLALDRSGHRALASADHVNWDLYWIDLERQTKTKLEASGPAVNAAAFSPDDRWFATGGEDGQVRIWDARDSEQVRPRIFRELPGHHEGISSLAFDARGHHLISTSRDTSAILWNTRSWFDSPVVRPLRMHEAPVVRAGFDADTSVITLDVRNRILVWKQHPDQLRRDLAHGGAVTSVATSSDGRRIATGSLDRIVRMFDAATGELIKQRRSYQAITAVAFDGAGEHLVAVGADRKVRVIDDDERILGSHLHPILKVAVSRGGRIATASEDGTAKLWGGGEAVELPHSPVPGAREFSSSDPARFVLDVAWDPTGRRVATSGSDGRIVVWNGGTGAKQQELTTSRGTAHGKAVIAVSWSPDGRSLLSGSEDGTARIWDATSARLRATLHGHTGTVRRVTFSSDGALALTASADATARVWSVATGELVAVLAGHASGLRDAVFTHAGPAHVAVTAGDDGTLRIWDARTGGLRALYRAHPGRIDGIALTPDGTRVVTAGDDGYARVFPIATEHVERVVLEHCGPSALTDGTCQLASTDAPLGRTPGAPQGPASCDGGAVGPGAPRISMDAWPERSIVHADVTLRYGPLIHRTVHPKLELQLVRGGEREQLIIRYEEYKCRFDGCMKDGAIVLTPGGICKRTISTPDFCTLKVGQCAPSAGRVACASGAGDATATLLSGAVTRVGSELGLTLAVEVDGCVLAHKRMGDTPIPVSKGAVNVTTKNRCQ